MVKKEKVVKRNITPNLLVRQPKKILLPGLIFILVLGVIYLLVRFFLVASVNGQLVSRLTIIKEMEKQGGKKTLDVVILRMLINEEAKKRKVTVSQKDIDLEIHKIEANVITQGSTLDQLLQQQGMTKNDLTNEIKLQLQVTKMVGNKVLVTDKEIDDYLAAQKEQSSSSSVQSAPELTRDQVKVAIKQQKLQAEIQTFVADLKAKAKIKYFINY